MVAVVGRKIGMLEKCCKVRSNRNGEEVNSGGSAAHMLLFIYYIINVIFEKYFKFFQ